MVNKPKTTLYMLMSLDGKISTGAINNRDFDKDLPKIKGVKEGLQQYYDIEKTTDIVSLNTGKVMKKIGVSTSNNPIKDLTSVSFVLIDSKHLNKKGLINLTNNLKKLYIVTTNKNHPAFKLNIDNLEIIYYSKKVNFKNLFSKLNTTYNVKRMTIQSGGTLNSVLIREGLIDRVSIVIAPCLVGGKYTPTMMDGNSLLNIKKIKALRLHKVNKLKNSYLQLIYYVEN